MASTLKSPGVYVEEVSTFPPSVAQVPTAIPAFIGYTEKQGLNNELGMVPKKIRSLLDYEYLFGTGPSGGLDITLDTNNSVTDVSTDGQEYYLYNSLQLFYNNGGGDCYIVSIGAYDSGISATNFTDGITTLKKIDEPTLYVTPDASLLSSIDDVKDVHSKMLDECEILQDRFAILDIYNGHIDFTDPAATTDVIADYRNKLPSNSNLKYGACYYPFLRTSLPINFSFNNLVFNKNGSPVALNTLIDQNKFSDGKKELLTKLGEVKEDYESTFNDLIKVYTSNKYENTTDPVQKDDINKKTTLINDMFSVIIALGPKLKNLTTLTNHTAIKSIYDDAIALGSSFSKLNKSFLDGITNVNTKLKSGQKIATVTSTVTTTETAGLFNLDVSGIPASSNLDVAYGLLKDYFSTIYNELYNISNDFYAQVNAASKALEDILKTESPLYSSILTGIKQHGVVLPPSGAIAGIYAKVDNLRGVWKAPANVGLNSVNEPVVKLSSKDQEGLNIDEIAGKSINVIRAFTGRGNLVWGARTLAGNDNEWRYVPVRRFFNMVEESVKKATEQFVFEANDANTWVRIRSMIENFLTNQWRAGALAGAKTDDAFYVRVGLGQTMTAQDILNGILNVEIGMAAVRPAEFIVLKFSHKLQES
ncbi:hypothetical protein GCM10022393_27110 [Aquimarina addita]|uniref:Tail sheath protein C-terminal domain-containing protein n=1 Tax=Aquimarina addita TaxID=870485 RepID=A0ABP6UPC5_9FLAO